MKLLSLLLTSLMLAASCGHPPDPEVEPPIESPAFEWERVDVKNAHDFLGVDFLDDNTGYVAEDYDPSSSLFGKIYKTADGGKSWAPIERSPDPAERILIGSIRVAPNHEIYGLRNYLYKSSNEGRDWSLLYARDHGWFGGIHLLSETELIIVMGGAAYKSQDGGLHFTKVLGDGERIQFIDNTLAYGIGAGHFSKTTDGGNQWVSLETPIFKKARAALASHSYPVISFLNSETGFVFYTWIAANIVEVRDSGIALHKTADGGASWELVNEDFQTSEIILSGYFLDENEGYYSTHKGIYKTTNGGKSWSKIKLDLRGKEIITTLYKTPSGRGVAIGKGEGGLIFRQP